MKKKILVASAIVALACIILLITGRINDKNTLSITIKNKTENTLTGLKIVQENSQEDMVFYLENIKSGEKLKDKLKLEQVGEFTINLIYTNNEGKEETECIVGYGEDNNRFSVNLIIKEDNGVLKIDGQ